MSCPICQKRPAKRYCPAKGEAICAVCCGTEREVTIDCPSECPYLLAARRYEAEHRKPIPPDEIPFPDLTVSPDLVHELRAVVSGLGYAVVKQAAEDRTTTDADALAALRALAEAYRALSSGILYEKPPQPGPARELYARLAAFLSEVKKRQAESAGFPQLKDTEAFHLLVFLLRVGRHHTNGRPRSRAFLEFLRAQYPQAVAADQAPRIILP